MKYDLVQFGAVQYNLGEAQCSVGKLIIFWGSAIHFMAVKYSEGEFSAMQYTLTQFKQCNTLWGQMRAVWGS